LSGLGAIFSWDLVELFGLSFDVTHSLLWADFGVLRYLPHDLVASSLEVSHTSWF
jgi:hypothetical protein